MASLLLLKLVKTALNMDLEEPTWLLPVAIVRTCFDDYLSLQRHPKRSQHDEE